MKAIPLALLVALLPAAGSAASVKKLFYLTGPATTPYVESTYYGARVHHRNTGMLEVDLERHGPLANEENLFEAPLGTWFSDESKYVAAAKAAGVEPIPLPASAWLVLAGAGAIGCLGRRRRTVPA